MNAEALVAQLRVDTSLRVKCPECSGERNKQDKDLAIHSKGDRWVFYCHHCLISGVVNREKRMLHVVPTKTDISHLTEDHYEFLLSRGISRSTADAAQLFAAEKYFRKLDRTAKCIGFPYFKEGKMVAAKYRAIESKDFSQDAGGAHEFWNIDSVKPGPIIIVEGEIDALTLMECGIENVVSVPAGAPMKVKDGRIDASEDKKFDFVWNANEVLSKAPYVIIATDNDIPGQALAEELARRIGKDRCRLTKFDSKDFNEVYLAEGAESVKKILDSAQPYPVAGLSSADKYAERLADLWEKGNGKGASTGYSNVDEIYTIAQGQLSVVTGYPSSGKSNFVDQIMVNLARKHDWKFAICSFENAPEVHISRLMEIYKEKRFFEGADRMTEADKKEAFVWVREHFLFLDSEGAEPASIDSILERARIAVARIGIRGLVVDPYNYIDNKGNQPETEFISGMLTRIQAFAKSSGVHVWFVAHPSKITRQGMDLPRPDGMSISGSMAWWAKADCGITVHRQKGPTVEIAVWKCRYRWIGQQGETTLNFSRATGTYFESPDF